MRIVVIQGFLTSILHKKSPTEVINRTFLKELKFDLAFFFISKARCTEFFIEFINTSGSIHEVHFSGKERM